MTTLPRLLILTDRSQLSLGRSLVRTVAECAEAGATHVVLRELDLPTDRRAALAEALAATGVRVIAAHHPLPAAAGLHLPAAAACNAVSTSLPRCCNTAGEQRTPRYMPRGRSCHTPGEVRAAAEEGFDYVTLGPYAATPSKPGYQPSLDAADYAGLPLPAYALGGITPANAAGARAAGCHGVAVMGAVMRSEEPGAVVRALLEEVTP